MFYFYIAEFALLYFDKDLELTLKQSKWYFIFISVKKLSYVCLVYPTETVPLQLVLGKVIK